MSFREWLVAAKQKMTETGIPSASLDSELLLSYALQKERLWIFSHNDDTLSVEMKERADNLLARRLNREPLAYIRGWQEFYGRRFKVSSDVLIPRPESESIITLLKQIPHPASLLDVGTGSGALGITAKLELPSTIVYVCDVSQAALNIAAENAKNLHAPVSPFRSNLLENVPPAECIIANLPYVDATWRRSPETDFEPPLALFAEQDGLALIFALIVQAQSKLPPQGFLVLEADPRQFTRLQTYAAHHELKLYASEGFALCFQKTSLGTQSA